MSARPPRSEAAPTSANASARDDARKPRSLADRLRLLLILLLLPAAAVCIPTYVATHFFGQQPRPRTTLDTRSLQKVLQLSADSLLPTPPTLGPDVITVSVRPDHLAARMKKVSDQAEAFGGSAAEGLSTPTEKRLSIELPAGRADAFRQAVSTNAALGSPPPATAANPTATGKDFVDIVIQATGDDE